MMTFSNKIIDHSVDGFVVETYYPLTWLNVSVLIMNTNMLQVLVWVF